MIQRILQSVNGNNNIIKGTDDQQNIQQIIKER